MELYKINGTTATILTTIDATDFGSSAAEQFGFGVALNGPGDRLAIGAPSDDNLTTDGGAVYYLKTHDIIERDSDYYISTADVASIINSGTDLALQADNNITIADNLTMTGSGVLELDAGGNITAQTISSGGKVWLKGASITADLNINTLQLNATTSANLTGLISGQNHPQNAPFINNSTASKYELRFNGHLLEKIIIPQKNQENPIALEQTEQVEQEQIDLILAGLIKDVVIPLSTLKQYLFDFEDFLLPLEIGKDEAIDRRRKRRR